MIIFEEMENNMISNINYMKHIVLRYGVRAFFKL